MSPGALLAVLALAAPAPPAVPAVPLEGLEPVVARQLAQVRARLDAGPPTAALFGDAGRHYHAYGIVAAAEACYRAALGRAPEDFRWPYLLGVLLLEDHRQDEAAASLESALARGDMYYPAIVRLAGLYLAQGKTAAAAPLVELARSHAPQDPASLGLSGQLAQAQGRSADAVADLTAALAREPRATRLRYALGMAYRAQGRLDEARAQLAQAGEVGLKPLDPLVDEVQALRRGEASYMVEGHTAFRAGDYAAAAAAYRRAAAGGEGTSAAPLLNLAVVELMLGDKDAAIGHLRDARVRDPHDTSVLHNLGLLLAYSGRQAEAEPLLRALVELRPQDAAARVEWALVLFALGQAREALDALERVDQVEHEKCAALLGALDPLRASAAAETASRAKVLYGFLLGGPCSR